MKLIFSALLVIVFINASYSQNKQAKVYITAKVVFCNSYCEGAPPNEEILKFYEKEYVFSYTTIILKKDSTNKQIKFTTNSKGGFTAYLAP